jgi:DNA-binding beta-propeller fold protein YncE
MPELKHELQQLAAEAARQARPMALADVIREADRRKRRTVVPGRQRSGRAPGGRRRGWVVPLTAAVAVIAVGAGSAVVAHAIHASRPVSAPAAIEPVGRTVYAVYGSDFRHESRLGAIIPLRNAEAGKLIRIGVLTAGVAVTPDGKTLYAPEGKTVVPIPTSTGKLGKPIQVGAAGSYNSITIDPNGKLAYVSGSPDTIVPINLATNKPGKPIGLPLSPHGYTAFAPDGKTAYVTSGNGRPGMIISISTATGTLGQPIHIAGGAAGMVFSPGGKIAYVSGRSDTNKSTIIPVNLTTDAPGQAIHISGDLFDIAITPDGKTIYAETTAGVVPVSTITRKAGKLITFGSGHFPDQMVITPDGKTVYVVADSYTNVGEVVPLSTATNTVGKPILSGDIPVIGLSPDSETLYTALRVPVRNHPEEGQIKVVPISTATSTPGQAIHIPITVGLPAEVVTP